MDFYLKNYHIRFDYRPVFVSILIIIWASYYYFSTIKIEDGGAESVLFIKPLFILLLISFIFVFISSVKITSKPKFDHKKENQDDFIDKKAADYRIFFLVVGVVLYLFGITFMGFILPSIVFIFVMCFYLNVRKLFILCGVSVLVPTLIAVIFKVFLEIPLPLWPSFF